MSIKFELGQVVMTRGVMNALTEADNLFPLLAGHQTGSGWGDAKDENEWAVAHGERVITTAHLANGDKVWILTEHDRSVTTVLFPDEY